MNKLAENEQVRISDYLVVINWCWTSHNNGFHDSASVLQCYREALTDLNHLTEHLDAKQLKGKKGTLLCSGNMLITL